MTEHPVPRQVVNKRKEDGQDDRIINLCVGAQSLIEDALAKLKEETRSH